MAAAAAAGLRCRQELTQEKRRKPWVETTKQLEAADGVIMETLHQGAERFWDCEIGIEHGMGI